MRPDQLICARCGATRATTNLRAEAVGRRRRAAEDDGRLPAEDIASRYVPHRSFGAPLAPPSGARRDTSLSGADYWPDEPDIPLERNLPKRRQPHPLQVLRQSWLHVVAIRIVNVLFAIGFGLLGGFLGGTIWCAVQLTFHFRLSVLAAVMGYLIGQGVAMGSATRSLATFLIAFSLTVGVWAVCTKFLLGQGFDLLLVDGLFLFAALVASALPMRTLPAKKA